jgi:hypothetical protein
MFQIRIPASVVRSEISTMNLLAMTPGHRSLLPDRGSRPNRGAPGLLDQIWLAALSLIVIECLSPCAQAAPPVEVQSVRVGLGPSNTFKIGCWTPVRVQLKASAERFSGFLELLVPDDDGTTTAYRQPVDIPAAESSSFTLYGRPGGQDAEFTISLLDSRGRRVLEVRQERFMSSSPEIILPDEMVIMTLGQPMGIDQVPNLPGFEQGGQGQSRPGAAELVVTRIDPQANPLPGRWYGFEAAHAIVIDTDDRPTLQELVGPRGQALVDWVRHGGHLVVAVGANWQAVRDSVLGQILPALPAGTVQLSSLAAIEHFAAEHRRRFAVGRSRRPGIWPRHPDRSGRRPEALLELGRSWSLLGSSDRSEARSA